MRADDSVVLVPYGEDPLNALAERLLDRHTTPALSLSRQTVLFPRASAIPRLRHALQFNMVQRQLPALLLPRITTLTAWARSHADPARRPLSDMAREWTLYGLLQQHPTLHRHYGTWPLIDSLLTLFDELSQQHAILPPTLEDFCNQLVTGYGSKRVALAPLADEAELVFTLWQAWRQHLTDNHLQDRSAMLADGLTRGLASLPEGSHLYLAGWLDGSRLELDWIRAALTRGCLTLVLHGQTGAGAESHLPDAPLTRLLRELDAAPKNPDTHSGLTQLLNVTYAHAGITLAARAQAQRLGNPDSPARGRLAICDLADAEHEARAVDLQVRRWLLSGLHNIGIITNDRKLARRVRALLDRAQVPLEDAAGWTLSTTSAATTLIRWLECLERDFPQNVLLDLLKSPFTRFSSDNTGPVSQFEQALVREHNLTGGLKRYRRALARHADSLAERFGAQCPGGIGAVLDALEHAATPLLDLHRSKRQAVSLYRDALLASLERLGVIAAYRLDDAGAQLLALIDDLRTPFADTPLALSWPEFRHWLQRELERRRFQPAMRGQGVELMGFGESRLYRFDALVIAGTIDEHLPGPAPVAPFFNDGVRQYLGLPSLKDRLALQFYDFRRLLEAAPRVLITLRRERSDELLAASPWVEQLRSFHQLAYGNSLHDAELEQLSRTNDMEVADRRAPRPTPRTRANVRPAPASVPDTLSASAHQRLIDCPYQFYCADVLGLAPTEEVRDAVEKSDYGSYVHRILQAFHAGLPGLPGPWRGRLVPESLASASALMHDIAAAVFATDLRRSYFAHGWLYRWLESVPAYTAWQTQRETHWQIEASELERESQICADGDCLTLTGRIDRLDRGRAGIAVIDYKTGSVPDPADVRNGERVQLTHYALLTETLPTQALLLSLQRASVTDKTCLEDQELALAAAQVRGRLLSIYRDMKHGAAVLNAWGDSKTCGYCAMEGMCRRELWDG